MLRFTLSILIPAVVFLSACSSEFVSQDFDAVFELVQTISLEEQPMLSAITSLDVDDAGRLLVTDQMSRQTALYNHDGSLAKQLNAAECIPGFDHGPLVARFGASEIIVSYNAPVGVRFDSNGECIGSIGDTFYPPIDFDQGSNERTYAYYASPTATFVKVLGSDFGVVDTIATSTRFPAFHSFFRIGGVLVKQGKLFVARAGQPAIDKYDLNGNPLGELGGNITSLTPLTTDVPTGSGPRETLEFINSHSATTGVFDFDEDIIMTMHKHFNLSESDPDHDTTIQLLNLNGKPVVRGEIIGGRRAAVQAAKNGFAYVQDPDLEEANPAILVYALRK